jgi:4-hydroxy-L-threonine phosphate dehydrogenase PdxA
MRISVGRKAVPVLDPVGADRTLTRGTSGPADAVGAMAALGLPYLRTSVDHGTAFGIAGRGVADARPLEHVVETTWRLLAGTLPRRTPAQG